MFEKEVVKLLNVLHRYKFESIEDLSKVDKDTFYYFFVFILEFENLFFLEKIYMTYFYNFKKYYKQNVQLKLNVDLSYESYCILQAIFTLKSFKKNELKDDINFYLTSSTILSIHFNFENKLWIFYNKLICPHPNKYKKEIFKTYLYLIEHGFISEKSKKNGVKTPKEWILNEPVINLNILDKFKFSFNPYTVETIGNRLFLVGDFFVTIQEIFRENIYSNKRFTTKDITIIKKIASRFVYLDKEAIEDIYAEFGDNTTVSEAKACLQKLNQLREESDIMLELTKEQYLQKFKDKIKKDCEVLKGIGFSLDILAPFKTFFLEWIGSKRKISFIENVDLLEMWELVKKKIESKIIVNIKKEEYLKILEEHRFDVLEFKNSKSEKAYNGVLDEREIIEISKNVDKLLKMYKNLKLLPESSKEYYINMSDVRGVWFEWIECQKKLSKLYEKITLEHLFEIRENLYGKKIYFPFFFDFRGRVYFHSSIGVTNFKLSRYFFHYGVYTKNEILELNTISMPQIRKYNDYIEKIMMENQLDVNSNAIKEAIFWILIALGKEFINKSDVSVTTQAILETGNYILNLKEREGFDINQRLTINHYVRIFKSFKNNLIYKRFVHKDATASFIQNTIRIVGPKDEVSLEFANLNGSDRWYDTYALALHYWKKELENLKNEEDMVEIEGQKVKKESLKYFIRKTIKKPIMTGPYQATYLTKWKYFKNDVFLIFKEKLEYEGDVGTLFNHFMKFLDKFWVDYFLAENSNIMIHHLLDSEDTIISDTVSSSDLAYYTLVPKRMEIKFVSPQTEEVSRKTIQYYEINLKEKNKKKMKDSIKANWVHFSDALLCRQINNEFDISFLTIHDCFLVDVLNVSKFIIAANKSFKEINGFSLIKNKKIFEKIDSIFIFL